MNASRRRFLATSAASLAAASFARLRGANEDLRVVIAGLNGRGRDHLQGFAKTKGVRVVGLCDVDTKVLEREAATAAGLGQTVRREVDLRRFLDAKEVDAVSLATPNHWHALQTIWACLAGKHVYVEKPLSHSGLEGRRVVEVAARTGRVVQVGTQARSSPAVRELVAFVRGGGIGRVPLARALCYKPRASIGRLDAPAPPPATVDYDLWCGPAPKDPLQRPRFHYDWHWYWTTGNGDLGNQGVHQMDVARWALGVSGLPTHAQSFGGRFGYVDDGRTPNTEVSLLEWPTARILFEVRGLSRKAGDAAMDTFRGSRIGVVLEGESGTVVIEGPQRGFVLDATGKLVRELESSGDHFRDFVDAIAANAPDRVQAPPLEGHLSAAACHLANASYRLGTGVELAAAGSSLGPSPLARALDEVATHLAAHGVDLAKSPIVLGRRLALDPGREGASDVAAADALWRGEHRAPFALPD